MSLPLNENAEEREITRSSGIFASRFSSSSEIPSEKYSWSLFGAHVDERQHRDRLLAVGFHQRLGAALGTRGLGRRLSRCGARTNLSTAK